METWLFFLYTKGMNSLEILAPVGSPATLEAALQAGCDAIYCALPTFGARAYADNFTLEQMKEVVHRCHSLNVKVHVTMNTLLFEDEIEAAYQQAKQLYEIGVDALIVQDLGLIHLLHERLPQLCLHASTQLSIISATRCFPSRWYFSSISCINVPRFSSEIWRRLMLNARRNSG